VGDVLSDYNEEQLTMIISNYYDQNDIAARVGECILYHEGLDEFAEYITYLSESQNWLGSEEQALRVLENSPFDSIAIKRCVQNGQTAEEVRDDRQNAKLDGVGSAPAVVVAGQVFGNNFYGPDLKAVIDRELNEGDYPEEPIRPPTLPNRNIDAIDLQPGWNLVSLNGELERFESSDCNAGRPLVGYVHLSADAAPDSLQEAERRLGSQFDQHMGENEFWIDSYNACTLRVSVKPLEQTFATMSRGWNFGPLNDNFMFESLASMDNNCGIEESYLWDAYIQDWQDISQDYVFDEFDKHQGVVINNGNACYLEG